MSNINIIWINDIDYDIATLPERAKSQINSIKFVDVELQRLQAHIAAMQTARVAYTRSLQEVLPEVHSHGDTMGLN